MEFFGYELKKQEKDVAVIKDEAAASPFNPTNTDGAIEVENSSRAIAPNFDAVWNNTEELITLYRNMALNSDVSMGVEEIVNDAIVISQGENPVNLLLDKSELSDKIKEKIIDEFAGVLKLLNFNDEGDELFKEWYVDGRIHFHKILSNKKTTTDGIKELRRIDSRYIRKVREIQKVMEGNVEVVANVEEYYIYNDPRSHIAGQGKAIKIPTEAIIYVPSGVHSADKKDVLSYLHYAVKPFNLLVSTEDSTVVYRIARAPERRVFYVDVGRLPKTRAEQYMKGLIRSHKNKMVYDSVTGQVKDAKNTISMLEDIWLPRREGCLILSTEIQTTTGPKTLRELISDYDNGIENWTYSVDKETGKIVPGLISWAGVTRKNSELIKVTLDNGKEIVATPDHKFIHRDGTLVETKDLLVDDSLMPFYETEDEIYDMESDEWVSKAEMSSTYIVYKTTNLINGKIYIGKHKQNCRGDDYLGSGVAIRDAISKYGQDNFKRETLFTFTSNEEALEKEAELVTEEFVKDKHNYNQIPGGFGGTYVRDEEHKNLMSARIKNKNITRDEDERSRISDGVREFYKTYAGEQRKKEQSIRNANNVESLHAALAKGRLAAAIARDSDHETLSEDEYNAKWKPQLGKSNKHNIMLKNDYKKYDFVMIKEIIESIFHRTITVREIVAELRKTYTDISHDKLVRTLVDNGYSSTNDYLTAEYGTEYKWRNQKSKYRNHRIVKIESLDYKEDVGTLTIDENHIVHDHHNFALVDGIFVMNSRGTEVDTLPGGQNLGEMDDVLYFQRKLYKALRIPETRLDQEGSVFNPGNSNEITRAEIKFSKFIEKVRKRFSKLLKYVLREQLILKKVITQEEWKTLSEVIQFRFNTDSHFTELKDMEILEGRLRVLQDIDQYVGKYFDAEWVKKNVLRQSEEDIKDIATKIEKEIKAGLYKRPGEEEF